MWYLILLLFLLFFFYFKKYESFTQFDYNEITPYLVLKNKFNYIGEGLSGSGFICKPKRNPKCFKILNCKIPQEPHDKCMYKFRGEWISCPNDKNIKCYTCPWKRPGLDLESDEHCCDKKCCAHSIPKNINNIPYYCEQYGICKKKFADSFNNMWCGMRTLYNTPAPIYRNEKECKNNLFKYFNLNKNECLNTNGAGWCTNYKGDGVCVPGTPEGPTDQVRYDFCFVNQTGNRNSWTPGFNDPNSVLTNWSI